MLGFPTGYRGSTKEKKEKKKKKKKKGHREALGGLGDNC